MKPVYIATKNRSSSATTPGLLFQDCCLVVEPQDLAVYEKRFPNCRFLILEKSDQGISYARNSILEHARAMGCDWIWMLDDDIKQGYFTRDGKNCKALLDEVLEAAEAVLTPEPGLAVGALEYQQFSWAAKNELARNSYCDVAVLLNAERLEHIRYRDNCKEDRDLVLQALSMGYSSARSTRTAFSAPKNGSNPGGLSEAYKAGLESHWSRRMVQLWPGICELNTKPDGRPDVKIHWRRLRGGAS